MPFIQPKSADRVRSSAVSSRGEAKRSSQCCRGQATVRAALRGSALPRKADTHMCLNEAAPDLFSRLGDAGSTTVVRLSLGDRGPYGHDAPWHSASLACRLLARWTSAVSHRRGGHEATTPTDLAVAARAIGQHSSLGSPGAAPMGRRSARTSRPFSSRSHQTREPACSPGSSDAAAVSKISHSPAACIPLA